MNHLGVCHHLIELGISGDRQVETHASWEWMIFLGMIGSPIDNRYALSSPQQRPNEMPAKKATATDHHVPAHRSEPGTWLVA
jgi:hypothetical protein